ncbi:hypothetical protein [Chryseobacterium balustinum]|uniref:hypothetical protein n=1 Tax=Chryseobacterium balustinum TaxID=246 RepID=UPI003CFB86E0
MTTLKKIIWYNMFDLEIRGKDVQLAKKGTSMVLAATVLIFIIDYILWNLKFISKSLSDDVFETMNFFGASFLGKILGLLSIGLFYLFIFVMMGRKSFFEQTLQEYKEMSLLQKDQAAKRGKYLIVVPMLLSILLLIYIIFFKLK